MEDEKAGTPFKPGSISWQWSDEPDQAGHEVTLWERGGTMYSLRRGPSGSVNGIERTDSGKRVWTAPVETFASTGALAAKGNRVYAALYSNSATGSEVIALDAASGQVLWRTPLQGIGPLHHSKYQNRVQIRVHEGYPVVFGDESAGRYIEALDPKTGKTIYNQRGQ